MGLRPARTCRDTKKSAWTRHSRKKPRKSYVKAMPHLSLLNYTMGNQKGEFDSVFDLVTLTPIQLRDNTLEAARQIANKYLEKHIPDKYHFVVRVYPHNVIRENKMIAGAGADRLQKGMRASFGRPTDRAARMRAGQAVFTFRIDKENKKYLLEAVRRVKSKLSGTYRLRERMVAS